MIRLFFVFRYTIQVIVYVCVFTLFITFIALSGLSFLEPGESTAFFQSENVYLTVFSLLAVTGSLVLLCLVYFDRRKAVFHIFYGVFLVVVTVAGVELFLAIFLPSWPNIGLHASKLDSAPHRLAGEPLKIINSWGQMDRERRIKKAAGTHRYLFIGDSFLEDIPGEQISSLVELKLQEANNTKSIEIINLGVSATAPDEYYWRTRNIGIPLSPDHCVMFYFATNDLLFRRSLGTRGGIAAPYPRSSVLSYLGLLRINHALTHKQRPFWRAWFGSRDLALFEKKIWDTIKKTPDEDLPAYLKTLLHGANKKHAERLEAHLKALQLGSFYKLLRNPPEGRFRSSYLRLALNFFAAGEHEPSSVNIPKHEDMTWSYIIRTSKICRSIGASFSLVLIPDGTEADPQFRSFNGKISDVRKNLRRLNTAAEHLMERARKNNISTLDLGKKLGGIPGNYLVADGHWSRAGAKNVATIVAEYLYENHNTTMLPNSKQ